MERKLRLLQPEDAINLWPQLNKHIVLSMPIDNWCEEKAMFAINRGLLKVWCYTEDVRLLAVLTTTHEGDSVIGSRSLLIYTLSSVGHLEDGDWKNMLSVLREHARREGYDRIIAYTKVEKLMDLVDELGGDTSTVLCSLPIGE